MKIMKIKNSKFNKLFIVILCISLLTSCNTNSQIDNVSESQGASENNASTVSSDNAEVNNTKLFEYDEDDYYINWADQNPNYIKLNGSDITVDGSGVVVNESVVKINKAGVYVISGKLNDGQIIVDTEDKETVRLVLNGAEIDCSDNSPIYVINAEKTVISLENGTENTVSDGENYVLVDASSDEPSATIFSKDNLTLNGTGTLTVVGNYNDGITSKDDLRITGGNIVINSKDDALVGKDLVAIKDGSFIINAGGKGIKSTNDTDAEVGIIYLEGGTYSIESTDDGIHSANGVYIANGEFTIATEDDGIHSDSFINISDGAIDIKKSYEGIESSQITITGGDINIISSDDGINASSGDSSDTNGMPGENNPNSSSDNKITINGGNITVNAMGDGLDSNGSIYMTGGTVTVYGPTSNGNGSIDYDREFNITGGTLVAIGSSGMVQTPSDDSTQNSVMINFTELQEANTKINLKDSEGNIVLTFSAEKQYQSIVMSSPDIKMDQSYTLFIDDTSIVTFAMSKSIMKISDSGEEITGGGMNQMPGRGNGNGANMPPQGENGNMPAPNGEGNMPNKGERPSKPGSMDGTTQEMPEPPNAESNDSETGTATTNN